MMELRDDRPVVVGINGPPGTYRQSVAFALREAALRRSAVRLVHGCQPPGVRRPANNWQPTEEQLRQARRQLRAAAQWARQYSADDSSVVCYIHPGSGVDALVEESETAALVVAQRREIFVLRSLSQLGSTTSAVTAKAQCPLVVLRPDSVLGRADAGVVVSIEDPMSDQYALRVAFEEAALRGTHLTVIGIPTKPSIEVASAANQSAARRRDSAGWVAGHGSSQAVALYARLFPSVLVRHHVLDAPTIEGLARASAGAELLIIGRGRTAKGRSTSLSAVARECVNTATCPVMIVGPGQVGLVRELVSTP